MDNNSVKQTIAKQFLALPKDVQEAILSANTDGKLAAISEKYKLQVNQMNVLENETFFIMLGLEHPSAYIKNLEKQAGVDPDTARKIAEDVNTDIFRPIRESLKKVHQIGEVPAPTTAPTKLPTIKPPMSASPQLLKREDTKFQVPVSRQIEHEGFHDTEPKKEKPAVEKSAPPQPTTQEKGAELPGAAKVLRGEEILKEIEAYANETPSNARQKNPLSQPVLQKEIGDLVKNRLEGTFKMPKTETEHIETAQEKENAPVIKPRSGTDAYREPIE